jgi:hypothetical protein
MQLRHSLQADDDVDALLKQVDALESFQIKVADYEKYFTENFKDTFVSNPLLDVEKLLKPDKHKKLFVLAILLANCDKTSVHGQDLVLIQKILEMLVHKILDKLIDKNFLVAILTKIENLLHDFDMSREAQMDTIMALLSKASALGDAKASCCLAMLYMGSANFGDHFFKGNLPLMMQRLKREAQLRIDLKKAINYLDISEAQGFDIAYLGAAYDLSQTDFESEQTGWKKTDIQLAIAILEKGYRLSTEYLLRQEIATKLNQLREHHALKTNNLSNQFSSALTFWKTVDTNARADENQKSLIHEIPQGNVEDVIEEQYSQLPVVGRMHW